MECLIMDLGIGRNLQSRPDLLSNIIPAYSSRVSCLFALGGIEQEEAEEEDSDRNTVAVAYLDKLTISVSTLPKYVDRRRGWRTYKSVNPIWGIRAETQQRLKSDQECMNITACLRFQF